MSGTFWSSHVPSNSPTGKMRSLRLPTLKKKTDARKDLFRGVPNEDQLILEGSIDPLRGIYTRESPATVKQPTGHTLSRRLKNGHLGFSLRYASWLAAYETFDFLLVLGPAVGVWHDLRVRIGPGSTGIVQLLRGRRASSQTGACVAFRGAGFDK